MLSASEDSQKVSVDICGMHPGVKRFKLNVARTAKELSLPVQSVDVDKIIGHI